MKIKKEISFTEKLSMCTLFPIYSNTMLTPTMFSIKGGYETVHCN